MAVKLDPDVLRKAKRRGAVYLQKYSEDQPRDEHGRWSETGAGSAEGGFSGDLETDLDESRIAISDVLAHYGAAQVEIAGKPVPDLYVTADKVIDDGVVRDKTEWINMADPSDYYPDYEQQFNDDFWSGPPELYHSTPSANIAEIERNGLEPMDSTRGLTNRSVGAAIFTSLEEQDDSAYGDATFRIDTEAMKADGLTPYVSQEPSTVEYDLRRSLANAVGADDYEPEEPYDGTFPDTVIVYGSVPAKYLTLVRGEREATKAFDPDQPRDEHGRWTSGGGSSASSPGTGGAGITAYDANPDEIARLESEHAIETLLPKDSIVSVGRNNVHVMQAADAAREVLSEMKDRGYSMPYGVHIGSANSLDPAASTDWLDGRARLTVYVPNTLPPEAKLDAVIKNAFQSHGTESFAVANTRDMIVHEMGHVLAGMRSQLDGANGFGSETNRRIAGSVSHYASHNVNEFLAESFTRLYRGETLKPKAQALYEKFSGPKVRS